MAICLGVYLELDAKTNFINYQLENREPQHKAIMVKGNEQSLQSPYNKVVVEETESFEAECTAYTAGYESTGKTPDHPAYGITASGRKVAEGMVAADTSVLPFGTKIWIEGLGVYEVQDTGGDIIGNRIDIYMNDLDRAVQFGRQYRRVIVLER